MSEQLRKRTLPLIWLPFGLLLFASLFFVLTDLDLFIQRFFFLSEKGRWLMRGNLVVHIIKEYGTWPATFVTVGALLVWGLSFYRSRWQSHRALALYIVLVFLTGPGLLVNTLFKGHCGRPRPHQVVEFGGDEGFRAFWQCGKSRLGHSFPSGHASMGFFWLGLYPFFSGRSVQRALQFLALGLTHGTVMGATRIGEGQHFASDVLWSAGFVYIAALLIYYCFEFKPREAASPAGLDLPARSHAAELTVAGER